MKRNISRLGLITVLTIILMLCSNAGATTLLKMSLDEITNNANEIVLGTVQGSSYQWDLDNSQIYTYSKINVEKVIKGNAETKEITVKTPGGEIDKVIMEVPGSPELKQGQKCIVFLYNADPRYLSNLVGFTQGKFTVVDNVVQENGKTVEEFINEIILIIDTHEQ